MYKIEKLPDYFIIKKLAESLWQQDTSYHGVAIMIGSGFSRSAAISGDNNKRLPLWSDLSLKLTEQLQDSKNTDPLRLAEIYCAYYGREALRDILQKEINDESWFPGDLYTSLLNLPWSEVLTTNWDTLLERAAKAIHYPVYNIVSKKEDLSNARSPRIVKLHGTIGLTEDLIFTEEDFRTYPQKYAAFVNFSRQVFIENELCLLGFSGDDPNFLQWAGWVRDHLQSHSRRIYLVGALNLTSSKRKYLENINIHPIDLYPLVSHFDDNDAKHQEAIKIFLKTLMNLKAKPLENWFPTQPDMNSIEYDKVQNDPIYAASLLEKQLPILEQDRLSYPNWLICPNSIRFSLQTQINTPYPTKRNLLALSDDSKAKLLYEIAWRHSITSNVLDEDLIDEFLAICDPNITCVLKKKEQMEIALILLKNSRWQNNDDKKLIIQQKTEEILEKNSEYWPESLVELSYFQAIEALYRLDYLSLEKLIDKINGKDPIWKLRKAYLLSEIAEYEASRKLIEQAYNELLTQYHNNKYSIYIYSRLTWAHWLLQYIQLFNFDSKFETFSFIYKEKKCDPYDIIDYLDNTIKKKLKEKQKPQIEPLFEAGTYKDHSKTITFSKEIHPALLFDSISNTVGIPIFWKNMELLRSSTTDLINLLNLEDWQQFSLIIRSANAETAHEIQSALSRLNICKISQKTVEKLIDICFKTISYWKRKYISNKDKYNSSSITRLRVLLEILARLQIRATPVIAKKVFKLAISIGKEKMMQHVWLANSINHLINYAISSIPKSEHHDLLLDVLNFPVVDNIMNWPNPIIYYPGKRDDNKEIEYAISKLIRKINFNKPENATEKDISLLHKKSLKYFLRILPLIEAGYTNDEENKMLVSVIYGDKFVYKELPNIGLNYPDVFTEIPPENNIDKICKLISKTLSEFEFKTSFEQEDVVKMDGVLSQIYNASRNKKCCIFPTSTSAIRYFDSLVGWRMPNDSSKLHKSFFEDQNEKIFKLIGLTFSYSIISRIPPEELTEERFNKLYDFYTHIEYAESIIAFVRFAIENPSLIDKVEKIIAKRLLSLDNDSVYYSAQAILLWRKFSSSENVICLIQKLTYMIGSGRKNGLHALLWVANELYKKNWLLEDNIRILVDSIPIIFDDCDYSLTHIPNYVITLFHIRRECVKLAKNLLKIQPDDKELQRILNEAKNDPVPEVRFAVTDLDGD